VGTIRIATDCFPSFCVLNSSAKLLKARCEAISQRGGQRFDPAQLHQSLPGFAQILSIKKFKGDGVHPNRHSLRDIQFMDDDSSQDCLRRSGSFMKLLHPFRGHPSTLKFKPQIRTNLNQPRETIARPPAHRNRARDAADGCKQLCAVIVLETRKGAQT
jgi:hypothetical protein